MEVPVVGAARAAALVAWLAQQDGITIKPCPADPETVVRQHGAERVLVVDEAFADDFGGSHPALVRVLEDPFRVETFDVAGSRERGAILLNVVLAFAAIAIITSGMQIATDATAGERERGSLEALLLNGARWQIAAGKWLAAAGVRHLT